VAIETLLALGIETEKRKLRVMNGQEERVVNFPVFSQVAPMLFHLKVGKK
jgi:SOS-response transcriptional repressor LexA